MKKMIPIFIVLLSLSIMKTFAQTPNNWGYTDSTKVLYDSLLKKIYQIDLDTVSDSLWRKAYLSEISFYLASERIKKYEEEYYKKRFDTVVFIFYLEGKKIELNNNFGLFFVQETYKKIMLHTIGHSFVIPEENTDVLGDLFIEYKGLFLKLGNLLTFEYLRCCDTIVFIYDSKPYNKKSWEDVSSPQSEKNYINSAIEDRKAQEKEFEAFSKTIFRRRGTEYRNYISNKKAYFKQNKKIVNHRLRQERQYDGAF